MAPKPSFALPKPKTPASVRHQAYPVSAPRISALKVPTRSYGKSPKDPEALKTGFGDTGLPPGGWD